jgi:hypothetical protein
MLRCLEQKGLKKLRKEVSVVFSRTYLGTCLEEPRKITKFSVRILDVAVEIQTGRTLRQNYISLQLKEKNVGWRCQLF